MGISSKAIVFVLLSAVLAAPLGEQGLVASAGAHERPAGCHEDSGKPPAPGPTSHQCCQGGHDFAILQPTPGPSLEVSALVQFSRTAVVLVVLSCLPKLAIVSGDPPIASPLRV